MSKMCACWMCVQQWLVGLAALPGCQHECRRSSHDGGDGALPGIAGTGACMPESPSPKVCVRGTWDEDAVRRLHQDPAQLHVPTHGDPQLRTVVAGLTTARHHPRAGTDSLCPGTADCRKMPSVES